MSEEDDATTQELETSERLDLEMKGYIQNFQIGLLIFLFFVLAILIANLFGIGV